MPAMGWLWTCLGGGGAHHSSTTTGALQPHTLCSTDIPSPARRSHRGRASSNSHALRLHQLPTQLARNAGYGAMESSQRMAGAGRGKCGEPENAVSTCISIHTLKKASEASLGASFRSELGLSLRSDVDDLKEELAALRRRFANEEAEAKKLREEISHLRSCGVLQNSEDASDVQKSHSEDNWNPFLRYAEASENKKQQGADAPVRQLRKCFSGPLLFDESSSLAKDPSGVAARSVQHSAQARISSHRAGLSPKPQLYLQEAHPGDNGAEKTEEGLVPLRALSRQSTSAHNTHVEHGSSLSLAAWVSQATKDPRAQGHYEDEALGSMSHARISADSMEVQWIEVQSAPCPSGSSTNVRGDLHKNSRDDAKSPHKPSTCMRAALAGADAFIKDAQRSGGKRRPKRSGDHEPTEKRPKDESLVSFSLSPALIPEQVEAQLSHAVAAFKQQRRELDAKHQSLCQGPAASADPPVTPNLVNLFRNPRKRSLAARSRGFRRPLSPVKEALSVEEAAWGRQSVSRNESSPACESECLAGRKDVAPHSLHDTVITIIQNQSFENLAEAAKAEPSSSAKAEAAVASLEEREGDVDETSLVMENIDLVPIQCASPSLSPKKRSASAAIDALCALVVTSTNLTSPQQNRYELEDSVEGIAEDADWNQVCECGDEEDVDGIDMNPIECASPSFSPRKKNLRGPVSLEPQNFSTLLASTESLEKSCEATVKDLEQENPVVASRHWASPHGNTDFHPGTDRSWYADAIDAIKSISDIRSSKERRLLTEAASKESAPAVKPQRQANVRPPQSTSAEKKVLRRAFSWYVSENDERMRLHGFQEEFAVKENEEWEEGDDKALQNSWAVKRMPQRKPAHKAAPSDEKQAGSNAQTGALAKNRKEAETDSGETATFSIDLNRADSPQKEIESCSGLDGVDSYTTHASPRASRQTEGADKENMAYRDGQAAIKKGGLRTPEKFRSPSDFNRQLRRSLTLDNTPILGSIAVHWENMHPSFSPHSRPRKSADNHKEDGRAQWHDTTFEERVERALANQSDASPRTRFGGPSKAMVRSNSVL